MNKKKVQLILLIQEILKLRKKDFFQYYEVINITKKAKIS